MSQKEGVCLLVTQLSEQQIRAKLLHHCFVLRQDSVYSGRSKTHSGDSMSRYPRAKAGGSRLTQWLPMGRASASVCKPSGHKGGRAQARSCMLKPFGSAWVHGGRGTACSCCKVELIVRYALHHGINPDFVHGAAVEHVTGEGGGHRRLQLAKERKTSTDPVCINRYCVHVGCEGQPGTCGRSNLPQMLCAVLDGACFT